MALPFGYGEDVCFVANDGSGLVPVMINKVHTQRQVPQRQVRVHRAQHRSERFWPTPIDSGSVGVNDFFFEDLRARCTTSATSRRTARLTQV